MKIKRLVLQLTSIVLFILLFPAKVEAAYEEKIAFIPINFYWDGDKDQDFIIYIKALEKDSPLPRKKEISFSKTAKGEFGPIKYDRPGQYTYVIGQKFKNNRRIDQDKSIYKLIVTVFNREKIGNTEASSLSLAMSLVKDGSEGKSSTIYFENKDLSKNKKPIIGNTSSDNWEDKREIETKKDPNLDENRFNPKTGDKGDYLFIIILLVSSRVLISLFKREIIKEKE